MISRLDAIRDIRCGRGIQVAFTGLEVTRGRPTTYNVILRRSGESATMVFDCRQMGTLPRKRGVVMPIPLTMRQVLGFIRRNFPRHGEVTYNSTPIITLREVA